MARLGRAQPFRPLTRGAVPVSATSATIAAVESSDTTAITAANWTTAQIVVGDILRNLLTFTEQFDNAAWAPSHSSISADGATAPDGTSTADKLVEGSGGSASHNFSRTTSFSLVPSTTYTISVYAKAAGRSWFFAQALNLALDTANVFFDLTNGVVGNVSGTAPGFTQSITAVGSGWYRCVITFPSETGASAPNLSFATANADNSSFYAGDGSSGVYLWGAQLEVGSLTAYQAVPRVDFSDLTSITAENWTTAQIAATESSDLAALTATVTTGGAISGTESSDTAAITTAVWVAAQIAALESSDTAAISVDVTTGSAIAGTESTDTAAINVAVWVTAQLDALESTDSASITAANWQTAQIDAAESSDLAAIAVEVTTGAAISATESSDVAAILAEGNASLTSAFIAGVESPDTAALDATVTTGASIVAIESTDLADITSAAVVAAQIAGTESPDTAALVAEVTTAATIAGTESPDVTAISTSGTTVGVPSIDGRPKYRRQKPLVLPYVVVTVAGIAAMESPDLANIQAGVDQAYVDFRRRLEIERDDMELLLEL